MKTMIFKNAEVFYDGGFKKLDVRTENSKIVEIGENLSGESAVDLNGKLLLPGFLDIHSHGCMGFDFSTASVQEIEEMCLFYAKNGITSVLATSMTMDYESYKLAMGAIRKAMDVSTKGSRILGINMEGPFLGADKKGAHDPQYLLPLDFEKFEELDSLSGENIRLVDIDPRLENAVPFIQKYSGRKAISLAHTSCDYETACGAIEAGASHITHLFNAMNGLHHREPGLIGALSDKNIHAEIICDGIHIHPAVIRLIFKLVPEKMILISDSMCAAGLNDGDYILGGLQVHVKDGKAEQADGTIAGSTTTVYQAVKNAIRFGVPKEQAVLSATLIPAQAVRADSLVGSIAIGKMADLLVVNPDFELEQVYKDGKRLY